MQALFCRVRENTDFLCFLLPVHVFVYGAFCFWGGDRVRQTDFAGHDRVFFGKELTFPAIRAIIL